MNTGDVFYFHDLEFQDGGHANKLLVILSDTSKESVVMVITTSKGKDYKSHGCQPSPRKYFIKGGKHGFIKDTWIDLARNAFVFSTEKLEAALRSGKAEIKMTLSPQIVNEIINCMKKHALDSLSRNACELMGITPKW